MGSGTSAVVVAGPEGIRVIETIGAAESLRLGGDLSLVSKQLVSAIAHLDRVVTVRLVACAYSIDFKRVGGDGTGAARREIAPPLSESATSTPKT